MSKYRKLIVALLGAALVAADQFWGISVPYSPEAIVTAVVPFLTAVGVWAVPNAQ